MANPIFHDRADAGAQLAAILAPRPWTDPIVLGLARGGTIVARPIADRMHAEFGLALVRKIGAPLQPELAVGALAEGGEPLFDEETLRALRLSRNDLRRTIARERSELARQAETFRSGGSVPRMEGRSVVLVDDGLATGMTALAAVRALRRQNPLAIVLAVPVAAPDAAARLGKECEVVCAATPREFRAVGQWYADFRPVTDAEVRAALRA